MLAYLVIREGSKWADVFRLIPGQSVTIGRAPTNQIVIKDERCSRCHAEIFFSDGDWTLRDLDSRNGTAVASGRVRGDCLLHPGDIIRIGQSQLRFVHDLSKAFNESNSAVLGDVRGRGGGEHRNDHRAGRRERAVGARARHDYASPCKTKFLAPRAADETSLPKEGAARPPVSAGWRSRWRNCRTSKATRRLALAGLFEGTQVDTGAMFVVPRGSESEPHLGDLELVSSRTDSQLPYHRVSSFPGLDRAPRGRGRVGAQRDGR